jgi:hypothetical protein
VVGTSPRDAFATRYVARNSFASVRFGAKNYPKTSAASARGYGAMLGAHAMQ